MKKTHHALPSDGRPPAPAMSGRPAHTRHPGLFIRCVLFLSLGLTCVSPAATPAEGELSLEQRRAELAAKHDRNGDGRIDATEREEMRLTLKKQRLEKGSESDVPADFLADYDTNKNGEMDAPEWGPARLGETRVLTERFDANKDGSLDEQESNTMLTEVRTVAMRYARDYFAYILKYDKNENGEFDGDEYATAQAAEAQVVLQTYDADWSGVLDQAEKAKAGADLRNGTIKGFYARFVADAIRGARGGRSNFLETQKKLLTFDTDGDGLASAEELRLIRQNQPTAQ